MGLEVRHLAALVAIDDERSFRGAAEQLGYVQSAISQQISTLERLVGTRLVERASGRSAVALTESGRVLVGHARAVLAELQATYADLKAATDNRQTVRIGIPPSASEALVRATLALLAESRPEISVAIRNDLPDDQVATLVACGELDAAFGEFPLGDGPFDIAELFLDPTVLVVPAETEMALMASLPTAREIADLRLIRHTGWPLMTLVEAELRIAAPSWPGFIHDCGSSDGVQALVAAGLGAALLPLGCVDVRDPRITVIELDGMLSSRTAVAYCHRCRQRLDAARALIAAARRVGRSQSSDGDVGQATDGDVAAESDSSVRSKESPLRVAA
jgi:DNA-binding transcriptional LysR family regulator